MDILSKLLSASSKHQKKLFVPCGAFWGANDIKKMADRGTLKGLKVTMKKHPDSLKLDGSLRELLHKSIPLSSALVLYNGK
jgi:aspartate dehydrogenase